MKLNLSKLSTVELATISNQIIEKSLNERFSVVKNHSILSHLIKTYDGYKEVYLKKTYSGKGLSVKASNNIRTKEFNAFKRYLNACVSMSLFPLKEKANVLYQIFVKNNSKILKLSYAEKTAHINNIISQLSTPEHMFIIEELQLSASFEDLKKKQQDFETAFALQMEENAALRKKESASSLRKSLDKALRNYISLVTIMKEENGWNDLYFELNEYIKAVQK